MNSDRNDSVRPLGLDEIERVAGGTVSESADDGVPPDPSATQLLEGFAVPSEASSERISPLRRFLSMRI